MTQKIILKRKTSIEESPIDSESNFIKLDKKFLTLKFI